MIASSRALRGLGRAPLSALHSIAEHASTPLEIGRRLRWPSDANNDVAQSTNAPANAHEVCLNSLFTVVVDVRRLPTSTKIPQI